MTIDLNQMCVYDKAVKYVVEAECRQPLHVGTGSGGSGEVLIHPEENRPFVQAAGIAGALREFYGRGPDKDLQTRMFGSAYGDGKEQQSRQEQEEDKEQENYQARQGEKRQEKRGALGGSRVYVTDGFFGKSQVYTEIRPRLRIDSRTGTGQSAQTRGSQKRSGQKFEMESVAAGSRFSFSIYLYEKEENLEVEMERGLKALHHGRIQLGGQKSNGCGYVRLISVKKAVYDFYNPKDRKLWAGEDKTMEDVLFGILGLGETGVEPISFELSGETEGGILVKSIAVTEYGENVPDAVNIRNHQRQYILPGSSVKGVMRNQIEKIAAYKNLADGAGDLFGRERDAKQEGKAGKIRCFDCVIGDSDANDQARIQSRIHIDKFTGGVMYGGLFSERPAYGEVTIRVELDGGSYQECGLVLMALRDIAVGLVPLGSGSSIGRGYLRGKMITVARGDRILAKIDCRKGKVEDGAEYVAQCLKALSQAGEG